MTFNLIKISCLAVSAAILSACTAISVQPLSANENVSKICIIENEKVLVGDFLSVLQNRIQHYGIDTQIFANKVRAEQQNCEYSLTYTALRSYDLVTYLSHAELYLWKDNRIIAQAEYHLRGKGGFALTKFADTKSKMNPVIDQLFSHRAAVSGSQKVKNLPQNQSPTQPITPQNSESEILTEIPLKPL